MKEVYFDNAATAFPKAPEVGTRMKKYLDSIGSNIRRGSYSAAFLAEETVLEAKEKLSSLFSFPPSENIVFTLNVTQALNFLLKGLLKPGDHCLVTSMEHNAVMRPLQQLAKMGVDFCRVPCDSQGCLDLLELEKSFLPQTKALFMTHASNVCGTVLPLEAVGSLCKEKGVLFIADTAQTAGILDIDFAGVHLDALAFTGHKGFLGPQGIGGFLATDRVAHMMEPLISGGTGSLSESEEIPPYLPDKFEAGTPNIPGIFGLHAALEYLEQNRPAAIRQKLTELTGFFLQGVRNMKDIRIVGLEDTPGRTAVVSLDFLEKDNGLVAYRLEKDYGIMTRSGLHCAPSAHKTLGTYPQGTVRFSFSHFNEKKDLRYALDALNTLNKRMGL